MEPLPGAAGSAAGPRAPAVQRRRHPPTLTMVVEALEARGDKRGTSTVAIRRYILATYPSVDAVRLKHLLKRALAVGLNRGLLVRPHDSAALGASGRFKLAPQKQRQGQAPGQAAAAGRTAPQAAAAAARSPNAEKPGTAAARPKPRVKKTEPRPPAPAKPWSNAEKQPGRGRRPPRTPSEEAAGRSTGAEAAAQKVPAAAGRGRAPGAAAPKKEAKARKPAGPGQQKGGRGAANAPKAAGKKAA